MIRIAVLILFLCGFQPVRPNAEDDVIMRVGGEAVTLEEFGWFLSKPYADADSMPGLRERLERYALNRKKVMAAREAGLDTLSSFRKEMNDYRDLLAGIYLTDSVFERELMKRNPENVALDIRKRYVMIRRHQNEVLSSRHDVMIDSTLIHAIADTWTEEMINRDASSDGFQTSVCNPAVLRIDSVDVRQSEFIDYLNGRTDRNSEGNMVWQAFEAFLNRLLVEAEKGRLYREDADYRHLLDEWRDGMLLYAITYEKVWRHPAGIQDSLEQAWHKELDARYPTELNEDALKRIK